MVGGAEATACIDQLLGAATVAMVAQEVTTAATLPTAPRILAMTTA